jgi:hypothetical protein
MFEHNIFWMLPFLSMLSILFIILCYHFWMLFLNVIIFVIVNHYPPPLFYFCRKRDNTLFLRNTLVIGHTVRVFMANNRLYPSAEYFFPYSESLAVLLIQTLDDYMVI